MIKITDTLLTICSLAIGILAVLNKIYWSAGISIMVCVLLFAYFSSYISQIEEHETKIRRLNEKLNIYRRLSKLEAQLDTQKRKIK